MILSACMMQKLDRYYHKLISTLSNAVVNNNLNRITHTVSYRKIKLFDNLTTKNFARSLLEIFKAMMSLA